MCQFIFTVYLEMAEGVSQWTNLCCNYFGKSIAILSEKGINFDKLVIGYRKSPYIGHGRFAKALRIIKYS